MSEPLSSDNGTKPPGRRSTLEKGVVVGGLMLAGRVLSAEENDGVFWGWEFGDFHRGELFAS